MTETLMLRNDRGGNVARSCPKNDGEQSLAAEITKQGITDVEG